jgi:hypothetical protein
VKTGFKPALIESSQNKYASIVLNVLSKAFKGLKFRAAD